VVGVPHAQTPNRGLAGFRLRAGRDLRSFDGLCGRCFGPLQKNVATCPAESIWPTGTEFSVATKSVYTVFEMAGNRQRCSEASSSIVTEGTTEGNVYGTWRNLSFGKCEIDKLGYCAGAEARNLPWKVVFKAGATSSENRIVVSSSGKGNPTIRIFCNPGLALTCTYGAASLELAMPASGESSQIWVESLFPLVEGNIWCSGEKTMRWLANYNSVSPAVFLTH
jgi:hypothetical protein